MFSFRRAGAADQSTQDLQWQVAQLRAELQERDAHVASLEQRNADDKSVSDRATRQVESAADDLREQLRGVRAELAEARAEVSRLQQQRSERQQMAADAQGERDALHLEEERASEREAELKTAVAQLETRLAAALGKCEEKLEQAQEQHREEKTRLEAQHREEKTRLEAQLAAAQGRNERIMQAFHDGVEREGRERAELARERDNIRETAERDRQALAEEWKGALQLEKERAREREAELKTTVAQLEARLAAALGKYEEKLEQAQEQHREEKSRLEAQLAEAVAKHERLLQTFQEGTERESRERGALAKEKDLIREAAERDRRALELEKERANKREAEAQSQLRQQEARHAAERRVMAETLPLRVEECRAREAAQRGERSTILFPFLRLTLLGRRRVGLSDTLSIGEGLYKLWKDYYKTGVISQTELRDLLRGETQIDRTFLNIEGRGEWKPPALTLPQDEVEPFYADVVSQLPQLKYFGIYNLPSIKLYYDPAQPPLPPSVIFLQLNQTPYTLEELKQICARYPRLTRITVTTAKCTNWGETSFALNMEERKRRVKEILKVDSISWS